MTKEKPKSPVATPDPRVKPKTIRRAFTTAYKLSILEQADQCQGSGEIGELLRREGLYSSHLSQFFALINDPRFQLESFFRRAVGDSQMGYRRMQKPAYY